MVTRIAVPFGRARSPHRSPPARSTCRTTHGENDYVWHCHILEHEENEMMQYYRIAD